MCLSLSLQYRESACKLDSMFRRNFRKSESVTRSYGFCVSLTKLLSIQDTSKKIEFVPSIFIFTNSMFLTRSCARDCVQQISI